MVKEKEAIKETIDQWERMILWAEQQNPDDQPSATKMYDQIQESWYNGLSCSFCKLAKQNYSSQRFSSCDYDYCPLLIFFPERVNFWLNLIKSNTWREWIKNAKAFLKQLKSLLKWQKNE